MAWTTPRTWAVNEQLTAALMNQQVRDNVRYLYDNMQGRLVIAHVEKYSQQETTSTSYVDTTASATLVLSQTSTLVVQFAFELRTKGGAGYAADAALHDGVTRPFEVSTESQNYTDGHFIWQIVVPNQPAGTYTYKIQFKITGVSTACLRKARILMWGIPEGV